jgi:hypothetical protein
MKTQASIRDAWLCLGNSMVWRMAGEVNYKLGMFMEEGGENQ